MKKQMIGAMSVSILAVAMFAGCATTSIISEWRDPEVKEAGPYKKLFLAAVTKQETVRRQMEERAAAYSATEQGATAVIAARDALQMYDAAMQTNSETAATYAQELTDLLSLLVKQGTLLPDNVASLDTLAKRLDMVAQGLDTYSVAMQVTTMEGVRQSEAIFALVRTMAAYENMYMQGGVTLEQYSEQMVALAARMREAADAGGYLSSQLADTYTMIGPLAQGFERRAAIVSSFATLSGSSVPCLTSRDRRSVNSRA